MTAFLVLTASERSDWPWLVKVSRLDEYNKWEQVSHYCSRLMGDAGDSWITYPLGWLFRHREDAVSVMMVYGHD